MRLFQRVHRHDVAYMSKGVRASLTLRYDMAGIVSDVLNIRWDIFNLISKSLELLYSIPLVFVSDTLEVIYDSRQALFLKKNLGNFTATDGIDMGEMTA